MIRHGTKLIHSSQIWNFTYVLRVVPIKSTHIINLINFLMEDYVELTRAGTDNIDHNIMLMILKLYQQTKLSKQIKLVI